MSLTFFWVRAEASVLLLHLHLHRHRCVIELFAKVQGKTVINHRLGCGEAATEHQSEPGFICIILPIFFLPPGLFIYHLCGRCSLKITEERIICTQPELNCYQRELPGEIWAKLVENWTLLPRIALGKLYNLAIYFFKVAFVSFLLQTEKKEQTRAKGLQWKGKQSSLESSCSI